MNKDLEDAFTAMIQQHERLIYKACYFYCTDQQPVEDLYQEVVYNLWKGYPKFRGESQLSTWIYRIAMNTCVTQIRKDNNRPKPSDLSVEIAEALPSPSEMQSEVKELHSLIQTLPTIDRAIVLLYLEGMSHNEISEVTGLKPNHIAVKFSRIKQKLKEQSNQ